MKDKENDITLTAKDIGLEASKELCIEKIKNNLMQLPEEVRAKLLAPYAEKYMHRESYATC